MANSQLGTHDRLSGTHTVEAPTTQRAAVAVSELALAI
jgi:hypothetical protein